MIPVPAASWLVGSVLVELTLVYTLPLMNSASKNKGLGLFLYQVFLKDRTNTSSAGRVASHSHCAVLLG